jgi:hypothetical protein
MPQARLLPLAKRLLALQWRDRGRSTFVLRRRGIEFGHVVAKRLPLPSLRAATERWRRADAVYLPGILGAGPQQQQAAIKTCRQMFDRLRHGGNFLDELFARIGTDPHLRYVGSTQDPSDRREIEQVFLNADCHGKTVAQDLWAKLTWHTNEASDRSLRIRFSSGREHLDEWQLQTEATARWVDEFALRAFPECRAILECAPLHAMLQQLLQRPYRISERILYNNAPGGGAVFHHDAEPGQLGVCFSQLQGHTAWFAIRKRKLARLLVKSGHCPTERQAMLSLDNGNDERLWQLVNRTPQFAQLMSAHGVLFVLAAGDSILLPSHGIDDVAWHSVFALGEQPSLAHSYGIFPKRAGYQLPCFEAEAASHAAKKRPLVLKKSAARTGSNLAVRARNHSHE